MKKFLILFLGFLTGLMIFFPKKNIYYFAQQQLAKEHVYIVSEIKEDLFSLQLNNGKVFYNRMEIADFKNGVIKIFLLYNSVDIKNLQLKLGNYKFYEVKLTHSVVSPFEIKLTAKGNIANARGVIDLKNRYVKIYVFDIKNRSIKRFLKKDKKGYYYYAKY